MNRIYRSTETIRRNPIVIVLGFIFFQLLASAIFIVLAAIADYGEIYSKISFSTFISFQLLEYGLAVLIEIVLIFYIFLYWSFETFEIKRDGILHSSGIIFKDSSIIPFNREAIIRFKQGPFSRLAKYGTVVIDLGTREHKIRFISNPAGFVGQIRNFLGKYPNNNAANILSDEGGELEKKASLRWDLNENKVNKNLEKSVMKAIVAFMNTEGGKLLIGVDDKGNTVGLDNDFQSLVKKNRDGFENHFNNIFSEMVGPELRNFVDLKFIKSNGKDVAHIEVAPSPKPVYLKNGDDEHFYIRTGNASTALKLSEANQYINEWWENQKI